MADFLDSLPHYGEQPAAPAAATGGASFLDSLPGYNGPSGNGSMLPAAPYGATDALAHGATFGLSGPVGALGTATGRFIRGEGFDFPQAMREEQRGREAYSEAHPWANFGLNILGGVGGMSPALGAGTTAALTPATSGPGVIKQIATGAAVGGGMGATAGASDNATSWGEAAKGALHGGEYGLALGGAIPAAMNAYPAASLALRSALNPQGTAQEQATNMLRSAIGKDVGGGGPSAANMTDALNSQPPGMPLMPADVGGKNVQRLTGKLYRSDTPASQIIESAIEGRDAGAGQRMISAIDNGVSGAPGAYDALEALKTSRATAAQPLYEKALNTDRPIYSDRLQQFLDQPELQQGLKTGIAIQRREAVAKGVPFDPNDYAIKFDEAGDPRFFGTPNMRTLDAAKAGLDAMVEDNGTRNAITGRLELNRSGRALDQMRKSYVGELDNLNPDYAAARDAWSGPSQSMDALRRGQGFLSLLPDEMRGAMKNMTASDREFFKLGAADTLRSKVLGTPDSGNEVGAISRSQLARDRLRPLFDNDAEFNRFMDAVQGERTMFNTRYKTGLNSMTAERQAADNAGHGDSLLWPVTAALMSGHPLAAAGAVGAKFGAPLLQRAFGNTPQAMTEAAHMLTAINPAQRQMVMDMLMPKPRMPAPYLGPTTGLLSGIRAVDPIGGLLGNGGP